VYFFTLAKVTGITKAAVEVLLGSCLPMAHLPVLSGRGGPRASSYGLGNIGLWSVRDSDVDHACIPDLQSQTVSQMSAKCDTIDFFWRLCHIIVGYWPDL
jgi:hypothetical protein